MKVKGNVQGRVGMPQDVFESDWKQGRSRFEFNTLRNSVLRRNQWLDIDGIDAERDGN